MIRRFVEILFLVAASLTLNAQDTITLNVVDVTADQLKVQVLNPLVMKKMDSLVLEAKSTSNLSELLIQHSPVFIKTYGPGGISTASFRVFSDTSGIHRVLKILRMHQLPMLSFSRSPDMNEARC